MVLRDTAGGICARISSLDATTAARTKSQSSRASVLRGRQNLVYGCGNFPQTTAKGSVTPPIHCSQHVQQSVDMSIQLPAGLHATPFKWLTLFSMSTYSSEGHDSTLE